MKIGVLKSIGHNIADSFACGIGLMIGVYAIDVYGEAACSADGHIIVDFLNGVVLSGNASDKLLKAVRLYSAELATLCKKHKCNIDEIARLEARFGTNQYYQQRFIVTVEDANGRKSVDTYYGPSAAKPKPAL